MRMHTGYDNNKVYFKCFTCAVILGHVPFLGVHVIYDYDNTLNKHHKKTEKYF